MAWSADPRVQRVLRARALGRRASRACAATSSTTASFSTPSRTVAACAGRSTTTSTLRSDGSARVATTVTVANIAQRRHGLAQLHDAVRPEGAYLLPEPPTADARSSRRSRAIPAAGWLRTAPSWGSDAPASRVGGSATARPAPGRTARLPAAVDARSPHTAATSCACASRRRRAGAGRTGARPHTPPDRDVRGAWSLVRDCHTTASC